MLQDDNYNSMPAYFRFLTLMAFHVFLQEQVRARLPKPASEAGRCGHSAPMCLPPMYALP